MFEIYDFVASWTIWTVLGVVVLALSLIVLGVFNRMAAIGFSIIESVDARHIAVGTDKLMWNLVAKQREEYYNKWAVNDDTGLLAKIFIGMFGHGILNPWEFLVFLIIISFIVLAAGLVVAFTWPVTLPYTIFLIGCCITKHRRAKNVQPTESI